MRGTVPGYQQGPEEPHHACGLHLCEGGGGEREEGEGVAGGVDDVVEFAGLRVGVGADGGEEGGDVLLGGRGGGEVAGVAADAGGGGGVGVREAGDGGVDAGGLRGGEDDGGALLEAGFGDAVADSGGAADDEDAFGVELGGVFLGVGHGCRGWGVMDWWVLGSRAGWMCVFEDGEGVQLGGGWVGRRQGTVETLDLWGSSYDDSGIRGP